ncbi:MFS transporter [Actinomadura hibisca]|uniref:MFS transporter n=1 Tax=Actinomadura hibisca TaxID=68565 RepID=UPI001C3F46E2|nr:MFS transporter [Actinomadura hibisca]
MTEVRDGRPDLGRAGAGGLLTAMCLVLVLVVASVSALNLSLPALAVGLSASNTELTWIADGYTATLAALVLPFGAVGDRLGRRRVLVAGTVLFGAASLAGAATSTPGALIACRVVMGVGAAMMMPGTLSTITGAFPEERRARGVAVWAGVASAAAVLGLLGAGLLLWWWSWRSVFVSSAVVAAVAAPAALLLAPETRDRRPQRFDGTGALTTAVAIGALVFAIIEGNDRGWTRPATVAALLVTVTAGTAYVVLGLRGGRPLLDPRLFGVPMFRAGVGAVLVLFMTVYGFLFVGLQYLQLVLGYSPLKSAVALLPIGALMLPASLLAPWLAARVGTRWVIGGGLALVIAGMVQIAALDASSGYPPFLFGLLVAGLGAGVSGMTSTDTIVSALGPGEQGVASALNDTTREVGSAVGIALTGSVFADRYRAALPADLDALPPAVAEAVRRSPAAGLQAAAQGGSSRGSLAAAVQDAFMAGLSVSLIVVVAVAVVSMVLLMPLRRRSRGRPLHDATEK